MYTPWGRSVTSVPLVRGIVYYATEDRGGYHLSPTMRERLPEMLKSIEPEHEGWFDDEIEWAIIALAFPQVFHEFFHSGKVIRRAARLVRKHYGHLVDVNRYFRLTHQGQLAQGLMKSK